MNKRELLELAAKAVGYRVRWHSESHYGPTMEIMENESGGPPWNPLTDDGDASRLAMKLCAEGKMKIQIVEYYITCFYSHDGTFIPYTWGYETCTPDEAFRECVTGAAAAIGELMP